MAELPEYYCNASATPFVRDEDGHLVCGSRRVPIVGGIPRFVGADNYAASFGEQWLRFSRTQLDSASGLGISDARLFRALQVGPSWLRDKLVLEAGCGAGRFTEVLLKHGAIVDSVDISRAVEANRDNCPPGARHRVTQADIYDLPFPKRAYDLVLCLGVVQHTPDSRRTVETLAGMVRPGGMLVFDHYMRGWLLGASRRVGAAFYRRRVLKLPQQARLPYVEQLVGRWYPWHRMAGRSRVASALLRTISPVLTYHDTLPLTEAQHREWSILDTHDSLTDFYKATLNKRDIERMLRGVGLTSCQCHVGDNGVVCRCQVP